MQKITSKDNEFIKHIKKLKDKKYRDQSKEYLIEGIKIIQEAIQENANIKQIVICDESENADLISRELMFEIAKHECICVTEKIFNTITDVKNPQGILAIIEKTSKEENQIDYDTDLLVVLDDIQDPGNLGTILRTVDSVGLSQIIVSKGTADAYNPKVVRSTMGAIFRVNIVECEDINETLKEIKANKFKTVVTSLKANKTIYEIDYKKKAIIIGNEANGVKEEIINNADEKVKIPMPGKTESLNASVATGIVLYEYVRQKIL